MTTDEIIPDDEFEQELEADVWEEDIAGPGILARMAAELGSAFTLVLIGVGTALFLSVGGNGTLTVAFGFAVGYLIAATVFGRVSGAHANPAVTVGLWVAGRFPGRDAAPYILAQLLGGAAAGAVLFGLASTNPQIGEVGEYMSFAANGFDTHSPAQFPLVAAIGVEVIIAALLVAVFLTVTAPSLTRPATPTIAAPFTSAPLTISLTIGFLVLVAIPFTNGALNPARATGVALFADTWALEQLWVFWVAPLVGAAIAGLLYRAFAPEEEWVTVEVVEQIED